MPNDRKSLPLFLYGFMTMTSHLFVAACGQTDVQRDFAGIREAIKAQLRDPDSAQFRNERIRTLWSAQGKRIKIYCAELNSNNGFGGKTGFQPILYNVSTRGLGDLAQFYKPGSFDTYPDFNANYYLACDRADTQRRDDEMGKTIPMPGDLTAKEIDRTFPPMSNKSAPDEDSR